MTEANNWAALLAGRKLAGRYEVTRLIGAGGFCIVVEAKDSQTGDLVALKVLLPSRDLSEFTTEGVLLDRLRNSSHVVDLLGTLHDKEEIEVSANGTTVPLSVNFLVLELADGCLTDVLPRRDQLPWSERLDLFRDIVRGVHQMHHNGVVHRDLKSENALLFARKARVQAEVADLGRGRALAAAPRVSPDAYLEGRGDFRFAPPELLGCIGVDDPAMFRHADLYMLGSVLYELATGQGITMVALGDPARIRTAAQAIPLADRPHEYRLRIPDLRARYETALSLAEAEFPTSIHHEATALLRQLCDPDPAERQTRSRVERRMPRTDLQWLLRRVDILRLREATSVAAA